MIQRDKILEHLIKFGSMTTVDMIDMYILRGSERIRELEKLGYVIKHERIPGKPYSRYTLMSDTPVKLQRVAEPVTLPPAFAEKKKEYMI